MLEGRCWRVDVYMRPCMILVCGYLDVCLDLSLCIYAYAYRLGASVRCDMFHVACDMCHVACEQ